MIDLEILKKIKSKIVERLFLIVFPPYGEESIQDVDIRLGIVLNDNPDSLLVIGTDMNDLWSPLLNDEPIPSKHYNEFDFEDRMKLWFDQKIEDEIALEYYEVTNSNTFETIIGREIKEVDLITIDGNSEFFGLRLLFENDFILSFPNSDGNTIETKCFNNNDSIRKYDHLGDVIFIKI